MASVQALVMDSPRPWPGWLAMRVASPRWNGWMRSAVASGWSGCFVVLVMLMVTCCLSSWMVQVMAPWSVLWMMALRIRLSTASER